MAVRGGATAVHRISCILILPYGLFWQCGLCRWPTAHLVFYDCTNYAANSTNCAQLHTKNVLPYNRRFWAVVENRCCCGRYQYNNYTHTCHSNTCIVQAWLPHNTCHTWAKPTCVVVLNCFSVFITVMLCILSFIVTLLACTVCLWWTNMFITECSNIYLYVYCRLICSMTYNSKPSGWCVEVLRDYDNEWSCAFRLSSGSEMFWGIRTAQLRDLRHTIGLRRNRSDPIDGYELTSNSSLNDWVVLIYSTKDRAYGVRSE